MVNLTNGAPVLLSVCRVLHGVSISLHDRRPQAAQVGARVASDKIVVKQARNAFVFQVKSGIEAAGRFARPCQSHKLIS